ncbi:MAG: GerAB/ArcD/ProY family transporter [Candidatus Pristimantibacillus sp.]
MAYKLSPLQLFTTMLVFLLGTSIIFGSPKLVPDTWLVDLITIIPASLLFCLFVWVASKGKDKGLYLILETAWGKPIGKLFVLCYTVYFLYIASRNIRDMIELIMTSLLRFTPDNLLAFLFVLIVAYAAAGGLTVLGRLSVLIATMVVLFFATLALFLILSKSVSVERLLPVLSEGYMKVLQAPLKSTIWFPYGEMIVFLVFFPTLGNARQFRKIGLISLFSAGAILTFSDLLQTSTLGMENIKFSVFALLDAARLINISNFITRMDALVALIIIFGVLLKCAIFLYAGCKGASYVFQITDKQTNIPFALLIGGFSIIVTRNGAEHVAEGLRYVIYWLHIPLQIILPLATLILLWLRNPKGVRL